MTDQIRSVLTGGDIMEHLKNILEGVRQVLVLDTNSEYIQPSRNGFSKDMNFLHGDARRVASDLSKVTKRYGEQTYIGQSK
jgi:hypothetical protein